MSMRALPLLPLFLAVLLAAETGCIRSRLKITSDPPGATVRFQKEVRGETPVIIPFTWYWHYDIELDKEGYEGMHVLEHLRTPPWFIFPLGLFAELLPVPIPDNRERHYVLVPLSETEEAE